MHLLAPYTIVPLFIAAVTAECFDPSPAFPVPSWTNGAQVLTPAFDSVQAKLDKLASAWIYEAASFSVEVTSTTDTLWSYFQTARQLNESRPGDKHVNGDSVYRIASISKTFTTLGLLYQHEAGNLSLDKPVSDYISELGGVIPWQSITLRTLASQLSGIPREVVQGDLLNYLPDPSLFGLPPVSTEGLPTCDEYNGYVPCNATDLLSQVKRLKPVFAPNQKSTYSNLNFDILGLVLERVTGMTYREYMRTAIFVPLNMTSTTLVKPPDTHAVLPLGPNYWDIDTGMEDPTGGIYSSSNDMSKFVRYILTHYNAIATGVNWMMPASWGTGMHTFTGMPFEIFRTDKILPESKRPVTFVTKGGAVPGFVSNIATMPEYGLGVTILVGCETNCGSLLDALQEIVTLDLVQAAEEAIWKSINKTHTGHYISPSLNLNSSLALTSSPSTGLIITSFVSNGTDVVKTISTVQGFLNTARPWRLQLVPTLLFKNETAKQGEIWRMVAAYEKEEGKDRGVWDDFCITDDDSGIYAGLPLNEVVFWLEDGVVELPAWKVKLRGVGVEREERLVVQRG